MTTLSFKMALAQLALTLVLFIPYVPLLLFGLIVISVKLAVLKIKLVTGIGRQIYGSVGKICYKNPISDVTAVSTLEEYEFVKYRSPLYILRMAFWTPWEAARYFLGHHKPALISEAELVSALTNTVFAHSVVWDQKLQMYSLNLGDMESYSLYRNYYWDCREVRFNRERTKITILLSEDKEAHWPCPASHLPEWNLAKLHAQVALTFFAPGLSHNHVHFVFPSTMTVVAKKVLPRESFLYRLLEPHIRFTERINFQALQLNRSTDNRQSFLDTYYFLWKSIPINLEQFVSGISQKCHNFYHKYDRHGTETDGLQAYKHPHFPPSYVQHKGQRELDYMDFLATYYEPVKRFVESVAHLIDKREWEDMSKAMARHVPGIDEVAMVDVVATFIHQVAVVHFCDHESYLKLFARTYGCMAIRFPYEPFNNVEHWDEILDRIPGLTAKRVKNSPELLLQRSDVMRTRCFFNCFVDYIPGPMHDLTLLKVKYNFDAKADAGATEAARQFAQDLIWVDKRLQEQSATPPLGVRSNGATDVLPRSKQLVPVREFVASVCF